MFSYYCCPIKKYNRQKIRAVSICRNQPFMVTLLLPQNKLITMGKSTHFIGQQYFLIKLVYLVAFTEQASNYRFAGAKLQQISAVVMSAAIFLVVKKYFSCIQQFLFLKSTIFRLNVFIKHRQLAEVARYFLARTLNQG